MATQQQPPFRVEWRPVAADDRRWEAKAEDLQYNTLGRVRGAAEKWAASLAAILGLAGTIFLVRGRQDFTQLATEGEILVAIALVVAVVTAAAAAYQAAMAAQDLPYDLSWPTGPGLRDWERSEAHRAKRRLRISRRLTFCSVILLVAALLITWFGKTDEKHPSWLVVPAAGPARCGELAVDHGRLVLEQNGQRAVPLEGGDVKTVLPAPKCPP
jgi:hypothetical protein